MTVANALRPTLDRWIYSARVKMAPRSFYSDRPLDFFIIGLQKSGSSWLTALIDAHPDATAFPARPTWKTGATASEGHLFNSLAEPEIFAHVYAKKHGGFYRDLAAQYGRIPEEEFHRRMRQRYNAFADRLRSGRIVGEKTVEYVFHLDLLDHYYPDAKKICIVRDPRDRITSFLFHETRKGHRLEPHLDGSFLKSYAGRVASEYDCLIAYNRTPIHLVKYEDIIVNPQRVTGDLMRFLDLDSSPSLIDNSVTLADFTNLTGRKPGEENGMSHFRKGIVGDWRNHLTAEQDAYVREALDARTRRVQDQFATDFSDYL